MKKLFEKYREFIVYIIFGVLTTLVSWIVYFLMMYFLWHLFYVKEDSLLEYIFVLLMQVVSWIASVLFAFFTNKKYVFRDDNTERGYMIKKLIEFASSRIVTLLLGTVILLGTVALLNNFGYFEFVIPIVSFKVNAHVIGKLIEAVFVVIGNYIISKLFVFKKTNK